MYSFFLTTGQCRADGKFFTDEGLAKVGLFVSAIERRASRRDGTRAGAD